LNKYFFSKFQAIVRQNPC